MTFRYTKKIFFRQVSYPSNKFFILSYHKLSIIQSIIWIEYINSSLLPNGGRNQQICSYNMPAKPDHVCAVDVNNWGPCSPNQQYGFNNSAPCVFIKLNRVRQSHTKSLFKIETHIFIYPFLEIFS